MKTKPNKTKNFTGVFTEKTITIPCAQCKIHSDLDKYGEQYGLYAARTVAEVTALLNLARASAMKVFGSKPLRKSCLRFMTA